MLREIPRMKKNVSGKISIILWKFPEFKIMSGKNPKMFRKILRVKKIPSCKKNSLKEKFFLKKFGNIQGNSRSFKNSRRNFYNDEKNSQTWKKNFKMLRKIELKIITRKKSRMFEKNSRMSTKISGKKFLNVHRNLQVKKYQQKNPKFSVKCCEKFP